MTLQCVLTKEILKPNAQLVIMEQLVSGTKTIRIVVEVSVLILDLVEVVLLVMKVYHAKGKATAVAH